jgi:hypothetical protein
VSETAVRVVSLGNKIKMVTGLAGTINVPAETSEFLDEIEAVTHDGRDTLKLTGAEIQRIEQIFNDHFA